MDDTAAGTAGNKDHSYFLALYELARVINSSLDPPVVLAGIARNTAQAVGVKACTIRLLDKRTGQLAPGASFGLSKGYMRKGPIDLSKSRVDVEAVQGRTVYIHSAPDDPRIQYPERLREEGVASMLVVPLKTRDGEVIGVLRVYAAEPTAFSEDDAHFLAATADLSAVALENARLHQALKTEYDLTHAYDFQLFED